MHCKATTATLRGNTDFAIGNGSGHFAVLPCYPPPVNCERKAFSLVTTLTTSIAQSESTTLISMAAVTDGLDSEPYSVRWLLAQFSSELLKLQGDLQNRLLLQLPFLPPPNSLTAFPLFRPIRTRQLRLPIPLRFVGGAPTAAWSTPAMMAVTAGNKSKCPGIMFKSTTVTTWRNALEYGLATRVMGRVGLTRENWGKNRVGKHLTQ